MLGEMSPHSEEPRTAPIDNVDRPPNKWRRVLVAALFAIGVCAVVSAMIIAGRHAPDGDGGMHLAAVWIRS